MSYIILDTEMTIEYSTIDALGESGFRDILNIIQYSTPAIMYNDSNLRNCSCLEFNKLLGDEFIEYSNKIPASKSKEDLDGERIFKRRLKNMLERQKKEVKLPVQYLDRRDNYLNLLNEKNRTKRRDKVLYFFRRLGFQFSELRHGIEVKNWILPKSMGCKHFEQVFILICMAEVQYGNSMKSKEGSSKLSIKYSDRDAFSHDYYYLSVLRKKPKDFYVDVVTYQSSSIAVSPNEKLTTMPNLFSRDTPKYSFSSPLIEIYASTDHLHKEIERYKEENKSLINKLEKLKQKNTDQISDENDSKDQNHIE